MADIDKNKFRSIVPLIREQLPNFVLDAESILPDFLEAYYEWLETEGNPTEVISKAAQTNDVNMTLDRFYSEFKEEYLNKFPTSIEANKENLIKNIREFYRTKGTEKAVKLLFRILFNEEIEVQYPSDQILKPSTGTWVKKTIVRVTDSDDSIFAVQGREVFFLEQKVVLTNVSGTFIVGETVDSKDALGNVYETGEIHSITNNEIIITTDFNGQFQKNLTLEGRDSNATGLIVESEDFSKRAFIENVSKLTANGTTFYECEVSGLYDTVKSGLIVRSVYNDEANPLVEFRNSPMVTGVLISDTGTGYSENTEIALSSNGSGVGFSAIISKVKTAIRRIPGAFSALSPLPSKILQYTPHADEKIEEFLAPGDQIRIGALRYEIISVDRLNQRIETVTNISSGSSLSEIVKSYRTDTRGITGIKIINPGVGYATLPVADLTDDGDGNGTISFIQGGSFTEDFGYIDDKGQPSSTMKIQNDGLYQEFSYVVRSGNAINLWRDVLIDHAHPAGMLVSGEIYSVTSDPTNNTLELFHRKRSVGGVNFNNPNYISSRNFFEPVIYIGGVEARTGLRIDDVAESSFQSFFEFRLSDSIGSYYTNELFAVRVLIEGPKESIAELTALYPNDTLVKLSSRHFRGVSKQSIDMFNLIFLNQNTYDSLTPEEDKAYFILDNIDNGVYYYQNVIHINKSVYDTVIKELTSLYIVDETNSLLETKVYFKAEVLRQAEYDLITPASDTVYIIFEE